MTIVSGWMTSQNAIVKYDADGNFAAGAIDFTTSLTDVALAGGARTAQDDYAIGDDVPTPSYSPRGAQDIELTGFAIKDAAGVGLFKTLEGHKRAGTEFYIGIYPNGTTAGEEKYISTACQVLDLVPFTIKSGPGRAEKRMFKATIHCSDVVPGTN